MVDNTNDQGPGSLRAAVTNADQAGGSTILFATSGVITLQSALPAISADVNMVGPGANTLSVSGNETFRVFDVEADATVDISDLTITDGFSAGDGGAIENEGTLTLTNCTVSGSSAGDGGGIYNSGGLTVIATTVSGNTSSNDGGGIENTGTVSVVNSTIAENSANSGVGGGINNAGALDLVSSTIADNSAFDGGGIEAGGAVTMANTIVGYNTLTGGTGADFDGNISNDSGFNLIADSTGSSGFTQSSDLLDVDPLLSALGNWGGPTQTISLLPGSPAIDSGSNALAAFDSTALATDQRGDPRINNGVVDIGAVETHLFTITILFGDNQSTAVETDFNTYLSIIFTTFYGEPVGGGVIKFSSPTSGASALFPGHSIIIVTNPTGTAFAVAEANSITGSYQVAASASGAGTKHFNLTNTAGAATQLAIQRQPSSTAAAGLPFATQPVIDIEDQYGNLETGDNSTQVTVASLPNGSGPLEGTTTVTASGGIATFTNVSDATPGTIMLHFTSSPALTAATSNSIVVTSPATQLAIETQPSSTATAGVAFSAQPVVYVEDEYGDLETGDNTTQVTASLASGTGPLHGTVTVTVSGGIATFTDLSDNTAETISLQFTSVPVLTAATSNDIVISPAAASQLAVATQPSPTATAGVAFATQPVVYVEDQYGNLETSDNTTQVTAALHSGSGPVLGTTTVTASGGIATFTDLSDDTAETISLQFTSMPALTAVTSNNIVISPAAATQLVLITQPSSSATAGVAFATQPVVDIEDQYGNLETGDNTTQVTATSLPIGSGPLQGTTTVTASGGIVTFTDLADDTAETISLHFTSTPALTVLNSNNIVVSPAAASLLAISTQPSPAATAGVVFGTQPVIWVEDQFGNLETSDNTTQVTAALSSGSGPLQGTTTVTVSGGIATFTDLSDNTAETISLQFTSVPVLTAATSNNIVVSPAAAAQMVLVTQPSATATAGAAFATQPVIDIEDQYGNIETGDNTTEVTASLNSGSGPLQGTTTQTAANGIVTFTDLADDKAETISLQFTSVPALAAATSNNIVISPAAASQLVVSTQPSPTATAGVAFATQPVVDVEDPYGNLETGDNTTTVTVTSLPLGSGPLLGTTTVTVSGGIATFTDLQDNTAETISLSFSSVPALTPGTSNNIVVSPAGAATQLALVTEPSATATAGAPFSTQPVIWVEDQFGNLETGDNTTQVTVALDSGSGPLLGTTVLTVTGGVATFTDLSDDTAETISLQFTSVPALTTQTSSNIVVSPAAASQLVLITQPSPTATAGVAFSTQPVVYVEDPFGNLETGDNSTQVTAAALPIGSGPLQGTTTVTASGGIATFSDLAENKAGTISLEFTSIPLLAVANSNNIVVCPAAASQLAVSTQPSPTATAGVPFNPQPVIYVEDQYGNLETGDNTTQVTAALQLGDWSASGKHDRDGLGRHRDIHGSFGQQGRDNLTSVHEYSHPDRGNIQQHRGQPCGGNPVDIEHPALGDRDGGRGFQHPAVDLRRRPVREYRDRRPQHARDGLAIAAWLWPAPRDDNGHRRGRHRHVHQSGGEHG